MQGVKGTGATPWLVLLRQSQQDEDQDHAEEGESGLGGVNDDSADESHEGSSQQQQQRHSTEDTAGQNEHDQLARRVAEMSDLALKEDSKAQGVFSDAAMQEHPLSNVENGRAEEFQGQKGQPAEQSDSAIPADEAAKVAELQREFGEITFEGSNEAETYVSDIPAALVAGVLVRGLAFLTSHRLAFYATLPFNPEDEEEDGNQTLLTGTGTLHFSASLKPKKRGFLMLKQDSLNCYSSSKQLDKPWGTIHLSNIKPMIAGAATPQEAEGNNWLEFTFVQRVDRKPVDMQAQCEFDDSVTASRWRNELAAAVFKFHNRRERFRASIPLDRFASVEVVPWQGFADIMEMSIIAAEGERQELQLGVLEIYSEWIDLLKHSIDRVRQQCQHGQSTPTSSLPVMDVYNPESDAIPRAEVSTDDKLEETQEEQHEEYEPTKRQIERFRYAFGLFGEGEDIYFATVGSLAQTVPVFGKLALSSKALMFSRKTMMTNNVKIYIPAADVKGAEQSKALLMNSFGVHILIRGQQDLALIFPTKHRRDAVIAAVEALVTRTGGKKRSGSGSSRSKNSGSGHENDHRTLDEWTKSVTPQGAAVPAELAPHLPKQVGERSKGVTVASKTFACLTIGSRGDIQPYIALAQGLKKEGHRCVIVTHDEYKDWIEEKGIEHRAAGGDPGLLMEISVQHKIFDSDTQKKFKKWFESLIRDAYIAVKEVQADVLIESPSAFAGIHIAEALQIAFFRAFSMPWTRTGDFPHAFINGPQALSRAYNTSTYMLFDSLIWRASSGMINKWRKEQLKLPATDLDKLHLRKVPTLYFFSETIVPRPLDWPSWVQITGSWNLEQGDKPWDPPKDLAAFIQKAREEKKPLVYAGFGSITVDDPAAVTNNLVQSVKNADVRLILSKGWSGRMQKEEQEKKETDIPADLIYQVDSIPHDWLFPQLDAAMHHGGAGTTAASLTAGVPTLIKPFFGDQFFWAARCQSLGAGLKVKSLDVNDLTEAWKTATQSRVMKERADIVGEKLRREDGVAKAINLLYVYLSRAQETFLPRKEQSAEVPTPLSSSEQASDSNMLSRTFSKAKSTFLPSSKSSSAADNKILPDQQVRSTSPVQIA